MQFVIDDINWEKNNGLVPCIVQDTITRQVLMMAYVSEESLKLSIERKNLVFYSRSRAEIWEKGATSGNTMKISELLLDCDNDTILAMVNPAGPACHKGTDTCWEQKNEDQHFLSYLERLILDRKANPSEGSYTSSLFKKGINKIAQKVGEEAVELVIEAKDYNKELFIGEASDLMYHYLVLLAEKGYRMEDVITKLQERHQV